MWAWSSQGEEQAWTQCNRGGTSGFPVTEPSPVSAGPVPATSSLSLGEGGWLGLASLAVSASARWGHLQSQGQRKLKEGVSEPDDLNWLLGEHSESRRDSKGAPGFGPPALRPYGLDRPKPSWTLRGHQPESSRQGSFAAHRPQAAG